MKSSGIRAILLLLTISPFAACDGDPSGPPGVNPATTYNIDVEAAYLVQSVQTLNRSVPIVAGRDAYLRVFPRATEPSGAKPTLRVRLYDGQSLRRSFDVPLEAGTVPSTISQATTVGNWTVRIPAEDVFVGLGIEVVVDPDDEYAESTEVDNRFPSGPGPLAIDVREVPPLRLRLVPVHHATNGLTGDVSESNVEDFLSVARRIFPLAEIDVDVRAPYTVSGPEFDRDGNVWSAAVSELDAVRVAEGSGRLYYGVVRTTYPGGGVVGIAAGIPSLTALGWDRFPDAPSTLAHELGHNFGRRHAPCGGTAGSDPEYPYPTGMIGSFGIDVVTGELKTPAGFTDIMGYCDAKWWISDYTFVNVLNHRAFAAGEPDFPVGIEKPSLVVWGRIVDGEPILEPAFRVMTRPELPVRGGPYRVDGLAVDGSVLFSIPFAGEPIDDVPGDRRIFSFAVPLEDADADRLATLRVVGARASDVRRVPLERASNRASGPSDDRVEVVSRGPGRVAVRWNPAARPLVVVRDPRDGAVLALGRTGEVEVATDVDEVELIVSDGVRSRRTRASIGAVSRP